jgi:transcriptional regulator with XRE-family HTH domain
MAGTTTREEPGYAQALGANLRRARARSGLSLGAVEKLSGGAFKGVAVGSWERGDRAAPVSRLAQLARFYGVTVADILPGEDTAAAISADLVAMARIISDSGIAGSAQAQRTARFLLAAGCRLPETEKAGAA